MKAGVIAEIESKGTLDSLTESTQLPDDHRFDQLDRCIEIRGKMTTDSGLTVQHGRAAFEDLADEENVVISDDGTISTRNQSKKVTKYTEFIFVPDEFVVVSNNSGRFLFDILRSHTTNDVQTVYLDLDEFYQLHEDGMTWKAGFDARDGRAENGVVHGNNVLADSDIGGVIASSSKNQLGMDYSYQGNSVKVFLARSGYIEVYQPSNYDISDFAQFVSDEVLPITVFD